MWPDTFGLACCAIEMMSIVGARYDIARFGMEAFRSSPRQADLLIVSGRVSHKMAAPLRQIYDQMLEPKWVIAMGACASSGGMFNNYAILQSVDKIVAGRHLRPGLPAAARAADGGDHPAARGRPGGRPAGLRPEERGDVTRWSKIPGVVAGRGGPRRDDARRRAGAASSRRARTCATRRASTSSPTSPRPTTSAGARTACPGYIGTAAGRDLNRPMTQGLQVLPQPKPKRFSVSYHLLSVSDAPRRMRVQTWVDDGEPVPSVIEVWPTADWHEREAWDLMGIADRGPPEPEADPHRRRLGRPPAAQGLPDRRRAGPLLGGRVMAVAPERTRASIYEGTRIPHPIPTSADGAATSSRRRATSCRSTSARTTPRPTACCA